MTEVAAELEKELAAQESILAGLLGGESGTNQRAGGRALGAVRVDAVDNQFPREAA